MEEPPLEFPGKCTALRDLLQRLATQPEPPAAALLLTDGEETCDTRAAQPLPQPQGASVSMVILNNGSNNTASGRHFRQIEGAWRQRAPWLKVIPPYAVGPATVLDDPKMEDLDSLTQVVVAP